MSSPVTLITGTRKGIGQHLARHYVNHGHRVVGCSRKPLDWELDGYVHFTADITDERAVQMMMKSIRAEFGRLDHLINNAGIAAMNHSLLTPLSTVDRVLRTNVAGTFLLSREAAKMMKKRGGGRIVNFSTVAVPLKLEGEAVYVASKAAVEGLTHVLAREFSPFGITVNCLGPVPIDTDLIRAVPSDKIDSLIARQAIPRKGTFEDVANVVDFYLSPRSDFITGQCIYLGGL